MGGKPTSSKTIRRWPKSSKTVGKSVRFANDKESLKKPVPVSYRPIRRKEEGVKKSVYYDSEARADGDEYRWVTTPSPDTIRRIDKAVKRAADMPAPKGILKK